MTKKQMPTKHQHLLATLDFRFLRGYTYDDNATCLSGAGDSQIFHQ